MFHYFTNFVQILCKYCLNIVQILCKYSATIVKYCSNIVYCALCKCWANIIQILYKYFTNIMQILFKYGENIVNKLGWAGAQSRLRQLAWSLVWHIAKSYQFTRWHFNVLKLSFPFPVSKTSYGPVGKSLKHFELEVFRSEVRK